MFKKSKDSQKSRSKQFGNSFSSFESCIYTFSKTQNRVNIGTFLHQNVLKLLASLIVVADPFGASSNHLFLTKLSPSSQCLLQMQIHAQEEYLNSLTSRMIPRSRKSNQ
ncbi:hypothetical protein H5410_041499 [Solanum commersonii]|uniref:Uncharacterized protein n=1 Tax=Solanum commersonii TaxID=4109 RepID=A0A9J5XS18_SOLCO|nr:hypothetical protein H5410_041499 [Solanum commersonii]